MLDVRDCLPSTITSGPLQRRAFFLHRPKEKELSLTWSPEKNGGKVPEAAVSCITSRLSKLKLELPPRPDDPEAEGTTEEAAVGVVSFDVTAGTYVETVELQPGPGSTAL